MRDGALNSNLSSITAHGDEASSSFFFFPSLLCPRLRHSLCTFSLSIFPHFFPPRSAITFNYFYLTTSFFFFFTLPSLAPPVSPHLVPTFSHCQDSEYLEIISDAACHASQLWRAPAHDPLLPPSSENNTSAPPPLIFHAFPLVLSAPTIYNIAISCLWQMKDLLHMPKCSQGSRSVQV